MAGSVTVVAGPSGVGKGTLIRRVLASDTDLWLSVSATTRAPRPGEVDGVDYVFLSAEDFDNLREAGGFLEWAEFAGNCYGTPAAPGSTSFWRLISRVCGKCARTSRPPAQCSFPRHQSTRSGLGWRRGGLRILPRLNDVWPLRRTNLRPRGSSIA